MELKYFLFADVQTEHQRSNCTFMELKYLLIVLVTLHAIVLIVPLWN